MKKACALKVLLVLSGLVLSLSLYSTQFSYVGVSVCAKCHNEKAIGDQYGIWRDSPHSKAYFTLKTENAIEIARAISISEPWNNSKCLSCHSTGGGADEGIKKEGVGCEACHGPGSAYHRANVHVNFSNRLKGYEKAKQQGMYPVLSYEVNLKNREKLCLHCHHFKRPCGPVTNSEKIRQKISIQVIDRLKKGTVDFSHPLRRF